jgi:predicted Fe-Mo cluster-binding NifX family protein
MTRIAIPIEEGRLNAHFGGSRQFALVDIDSARQAALRSEVVPAPEHQPGLFPKWLRAQGAQVVIAGGMGQRALTLFAQHNIAVCAAEPGTPLEALVADWLAGRLTAPPAACDHHHHHHAHEHEHGHEHPASQSQARKVNPLRTPEPRPETGP